MRTATPHRADIHPRDLHDTDRRRRGRRRVLALVGLTALVGTAAACGDDDEGDAGIEITDAWARTSPAVARAGAVYMQLANSGDTDDALVDVSVDESVAATAELHETVVAGGAMGSETTMAGETTGDTTGGMAGGSDMMAMQPVDRIDVPAGATVSLEPGGYHVMLLELVEPLEAGDTVELTLTFETAGEQVVVADVRDDAP